MINRIQHLCSHIIEFIKLVTKKRDKTLGKTSILSLSLTRLINSVKHEHSCKILYICNKRSTHSCKILYICNKRNTHSCKILYICNKRYSHVRFSISATRGALVSDPLYLQQEGHSCKILYICKKWSTRVRSSISATRGALV